MLCTAHNIKHKRTSPYTSHSNGAVERLHRTIEDLLRRCLVTLPHTAWPTLILDLQLTINTTYARSVGCAPYLIMFGTTPPTLTYHLPDPTTTTVKQYAAAVARQLDTIRKATTAAHTAYRKREDKPPSALPTPCTLTPGRLAMVIHPRTNKILTTNAGPFLVTHVDAPHV